MKIAVLLACLLTTQMMTHASAQSSTEANSLLVTRGNEKPSFDCSQAKTASARLICGDGELARLDGELGVAFRKARAQAPAAERQKLVADEVSWIRNRNRRCDLVGKDNAGLEILATSKQCVEDAFRERLKALGQDGSASVGSEPKSVQVPNVASRAKNAIAGTYTGEIKRRYLNLPLPLASRFYRIVINPDLATGKGWVYEDGVLLTEIKISGHMETATTFVGDTDYGNSPNAPPDRVKLEFYPVTRTLRWYHTDKQVEGTGILSSNNAPQERTLPVQASQGQPLGHVLCTHADGDYFQDTISIAPSALEQFAERSHTVSFLDQVRTAGKAYCAQQRAHGHSLGQGTTASGIPLVSAYPRNIQIEVYSGNERQVFATGDLNGPWERIESLPESKRLAREAAQREKQAALEAAAATERARKEFASGAGDPISGVWSSGQIKLTVRKEGELYLVRVEGNNMDGEYAGPYKNSQIEIGGLVGNISVLPSTAQLIFGGKRFSKTSD